MSEPGNPLEPRLERIVERWTERIVEGLASGASPAVVVREHLTAALVEATSRSGGRDESPPSTRAEQMARAEERLRLILEASGMGTWDIDLATEDMVTDDRFHELFGVTSEQALVPAERLARVHPDDLGPAWRAMGEAAAGVNGGVYFQHYRTWSLPGGGWRWLEARGRAVRSRDGQTNRLIGTVLDVTERKQLEAERERAVLLHQRQAEFEQHLVGIVSHDLRTPLNAILLGASALMASEQLDGMSLRIASRIRSSAERAGRMIRDLLDFTQARLGGGIPVRPGPLDLHALVHQVVEEVEASTPGRQIERHHEGDGSLEGDSDRLAQLLVNLLTNALKYSPAGSPIRVTTRGNEQSLWLLIQNHGAPIAPAKLETLFEPMQRATADIDRLGRSVGLGLYIVRHIVDAHHGTIEVTSSQDEGTTFTVRLPRRQRPAAG